MALIFKRIFAGQSQKVEYSFVYINLLNHFDQLILTHIEPAFQAEVRSAFQTFIYTNLP